MELAKQPKNKIEEETGEIETPKIVINKESEAETLDLVNAILKKAGIDPYKPVNLLGKENTTKDNRSIRVYESNGLIVTQERIPEGPNGKLEITIRGLDAESMVA